MRSHGRGMEESKDGKIDIRVRPEKGSGWETGGGVKQTHGFGLGRRARKAGSIRQM